MWLPIVVSSSMASLASSSLRMVHHYHYGCGRFFPYRYQSQEHKPISLNHQDILPPQGQNKALPSSYLTNGPGTNAIYALTSRLQSCPQYNTISPSDLNTEHSLIISLCRIVASYDISILFLYLLLTLIHSILVYIATILLYKYASSGLAEGHHKEATVAPFLSLSHVRFLSLSDSSLNDTICY